MSVTRVTASQAHRPAACRDRDCPRPLCRAYRDGHEDGYTEGYAAGARAAQDGG